MNLVSCVTYSNSYFLKNDSNPNHSTCFALPLGKVNTSTDIYFASAFCLFSLPRFSGFFFFRLRAAAATPLDNNQRTRDKSLSSSSSFFHPFFSLPPFLCAPNNHLMTQLPFFTPLPVPSNDGGVHLKRAGPQNIGGARR